MTQKTVEGLALKEYPDDKTEDNLVRNLRHLNRKAFIKGYNSAQTPNWTKLPELPEKDEDYWVQSDINPIPQIAWFDLETKSFYWDNKLIGRINILDVLAWAEITKPEPFKGDV